MGPTPSRQASIKTDCSLSVDFLHKNLDHVADPPRFEHGLQAPQARVISRLHYGSNASPISKFGIMSTVVIGSMGEVFSI